MVVSVAPDTKVLVVPRPFHGRVDVVVSPGGPGEVILSFPLEQAEGVSTALASAAVEVRRFLEDCIAERVE